MTADGSGDPNGQRDGLGGPAESGRSDRIGAFFDIDLTVLEVNSGTKWVGHQWKHDRMTMLEVMRALWWTVQYRFGLLDFEAMAGRVIAGYRGQEVAPLEQEVAAWFREEIAATICVQAREHVEAHRRSGHVIALLTSATRFLSAPVGRALGVEHMLCTEVGEQDGRFTGTHVSPACYGAGKVLRAESFAAEHGIDLRRSFFYSDSFSDLPMLERVGEPRVINPDPRLRRLAQRRGWSVQTWRAPLGAPTMTCD
ncbi:HAD family hydrolase [Paraliomyxa miuraensis]|uniref:HAD family hydrolase n=1 Tax=Paraliomyxa miuraensis TaxID=376150 RepID=UPI0022542087|nr:HAD family hydrolase [Paraliomyxa miuraensis]MCX4243537.1 HAD-IB family hydrolase [Paraliomyxa miuraensis]